MGWGELKNCSLSLDSGTGLTINLRPAEWTTWAAELGGTPGREKDFSADASLKGDINLFYIVGL